MLKNYNAMLLGRDFMEEGCMCPEAITYSNEIDSVLGKRSLMIKFRGSTTKNIDIFILMTLNHYNELTNHACKLLQ